MLAKTSNFSRDEVLRLITLHEEATVGEAGSRWMIDIISDSRRLPGEDGPQEVS